MFIGYVNYYCTCCRATHISLNRIDLRFDNLLHGQTKCREHLHNAFAYGYKSIACPGHSKWFSIHTNASDFQLGTCIIQEEGRLLLLLQSHNATAKLYYIWTVNTFHHSYSQRILRYALQRTFTFLWNIKTWCSILSWYMKIKQFSSLNVIGPPQYSSHN